MYTNRSLSTRRSRHSAEILILARLLDTSHESNGAGVGITDDELVYVYKLLVFNPVMLSSFSLQ